MSKQAKQPNQPEDAPGPAPEHVVEAVVTAWMEYVKFFWRQVGWITIIEGGAYAAFYKLKGDEEYWLALAVNIVAIVLLIQLWFALNRFKKWMDNHRIAAKKVLGHWYVKQPETGPFAKRGAGDIPLFTIPILGLGHLILAGWTVVALAS